MSFVDSSAHLKPLSVYSQKVCTNQQSIPSRPYYNIQVQISNQKDRGQKRQLDDSCFEETYETPLKRPCIISSCSPDVGCFSFEYQATTPFQKLIITKIVTPPRSKVSQPVTPAISTPLSKCAKDQLDQDWESLPSPIPDLRWDREASLPDISLNASLNFNVCDSVPSVASKGTEKVEVRNVSPNLNLIHESKSEVVPSEILVPLGAKESCRNEESTTESFESTLPLEVQVKSKVVVPDKTTFRPVKCLSEEEWEKNKKTYVESVKRHMTEQNGVMQELHSLMNSVANMKPGKNSQHWQHPSDLTMSNYKLSHVRGPLISLDEWQKRNPTHQRFAKVPDIFHRSPML